MESLVQNNSPITVIMTTMMMKMAAVDLEEWEYL